MITRKNIQRVSIGTRTIFARAFPMQTIERREKTTNKLQK